MRPLALVAALAACNAYELPPSPDRDAKPIANAGTGSTFNLGEPITLDGTGSYDPDGEIASYRWYGVAVPAGSTARPADVNAAVTTFVPDVFGAYQLQLVVQDENGNSDESDLSFDVGQVSAIDAGPDTTVPWLGTARLNGVIVGGAGTASWSLDSKPPASMATLIGSATLTPTFRADVAGTYGLTLTVRAGPVTFTDAVTITATATGLPLGTGIYGYQYSTAHDRLLVLRNVGQGAELEVIDPLTGVQTSVAAGIPSGYTMAIDPAGDRVAIAGDRKVSLIRVSPPQLIDVYDIPIFPWKIVFGADNRVHAFEAGTLQLTPLPSFVSLDLGTRATVVATSPVTRPNTAATRDGRRMYLVSDLTSDFFVYDLTTSPITITAHPTSIGGSPPVFADELGRWAVVGRGTVIDTTTSTPTLKSSLGVGTETLVSLAQCAARNEIAVGGSNTPPSHLMLFNGTTFIPSLRAPVPEINSMSTSAAFVAYDSSATHMFVVASTSFAGAVLHVVPL